MIISPLPNTRPLVVFVNPKSGGRQGARLVQLMFFFVSPFLILFFFGFKDIYISLLFEKIPLDFIFL